MATLSNDNFSKWGAPGQRAGPRENFCGIRAANRAPQGRDKAGAAAAAVEWRAGSARLAFEGVRRYDPGCVCRPPFGRKPGSRRLVENLGMPNSKLTWLAVGLMAGVVIGLNASGLWPQVPLHAVATHGQDNFAICTGPLDDEIEAIFVLDFATGDLKAR